MRLIDADKLQEFPIRANRCDKEHANKHFINGIESVMEYAELLPTVDAEVAVRCKDCAYAELYEGSECLYCMNIDGLCTYVMDDDYCSYGERKDSAENAVD